MAHASELRFESDVKMKQLDQPAFSTVKAGETINLKAGDATLMVSKKGLPVLIFIPGSSDAKLLLKDSHFDDALREQLSPSLDTATNEIVTGLRKAETLIHKKEIGQALTVVNALKAKYKNVSSVLFMSGTLAYLQNDKAGALTDLEKGLEIDPQDEAAKSLLLRLKGGK